MTYLLWACDMVRLLCGGWLCGCVCAAALVGLRFWTDSWVAKGPWRGEDFEKGETT
mgnify:CR=1 FL=1